MMVSVLAYKKNENDVYVIDKRVDCSEREAQKYVKMFFDMGYDRVRVE